MGAGLLGGSRIYTEQCFGSVFVWRVFYLTRGQWLLGTGYFSGEGILVIDGSVAGKIPA